jgi:hypothetical protein
MEIDSAKGRPRLFLATGEHGKDCVLNVIDDNIHPVILLCAFFRESNVVAPVKHH